MIAHVVLFEPKSTVSAGAKRDFLDEIRSVARNIPSIGRALIGRTTSLAIVPANSIGQQTYEYSAIFEFVTEGDLQAYLTHPSHDRLRALFWEYCQATLIADMDLDDPSSAQLDKLV